MMKKLIIAFLVFSLLIPFGKKVEADEYKDEVISARFYVTATGRNTRYDVNYNKGWFGQDARIYSHDLAKLSIGLATCAFRPFGSLREEIQADRNLSEFLRDAHFLDLRSDDYDKDPSMYTVSTCMGHQKLKDEQGEYELIAVGVCGQGYVDEWESNFSIGDGTMHEGFDRSSSLVYDRIFGYIASRHLEGRLKIWISGFSRAAAISNITAARLSDSSAFGQENVFAYTFATPRTVIDENAGRYENIFNIIGKADPVPDVPFKEWGYGRYGRDLYTPILETDSDFEVKKARANEVYKKITGIDYWYNKEANETIANILSYCLEICPTKELYAQSLQGKLIHIWENKNRIYVLKDLLELASDPVLINEDNKAAADALMDYLTLLIRDYYDSESMFEGWNESAKPAANLLQAHTPDLYVSWMMSTNTADELYSENLEYKVVSITSIYKVELYRDGKLIETIDPIVSSVNGEYKVTTPKNERKLPENNVYLSYSENEIRALIPCDRKYSLKVSSKDDGGVYENMVLSHEAGCAVKQSIHFIFYTLENNDSFEVIFMPDGKVNYASDKGLDRNRLEESEHELDTTISLIVTRSKFMNLTWRQLTITVIGAALLVASLLLFAFSYGVARFRFSRRKKKGFIKQDVKFEGWPLLCDLAVILLFLFREFYTVLFPENQVLSLGFKLLIGLICLMVAYIGYRRRKDDLSLYIMIAAAILMVADLMTTNSLGVGGLLHICAYAVLCYAYIREEKPEKGQIILWIVLSLAGAIIAMFIKGEYGALRFLAALYICTSLAMVISSFTMPKRTFRGSLLLFASGILLMANRVYGASFVSHIISLGTYYIALLLLVSTGLRQKAYRMVAVFDDEEESEAE